MIFHWQNWGIYWYTTVYLYNWDAITYYDIQNDNSMSWYRMITLKQYYDIMSKYYAIKYYDPMNRIDNFNSFGQT